MTRTREENAADLAAETRPEFTERFDSWVIPGEHITCDFDGFHCVATAHHDDDASPPWKRDDGHGPVSEWTTRPKEPGERILASDGRGWSGARRYYDFAGAVKQARAEGWGTKDDDKLTPGQRAEKAAEEDFRVLKAWCDDEWHYTGIAVQVWRKGVPLTGEYEHACWGIERNYPGSDNDYLRTVANELLDDAIDAARAKLAKLTA